MVNQNSVNKNRFHQTNESRKTDSRKATPKGLKTGFFLLMLLVFLGSASILLEYLGIVNLVSSFGGGGRPALQLGFWHLTDIADDYWARPFINGLDVDGLVQHKALAGYPNDEFRPEQPVTRAEFAAMLYAAFGDKSVPQTELKFKDVSSDFWGALAIAKTTAGGFWKGYSDQTFRPHQMMSRAQALAVLAQGLNLKTESSPEEILIIYKDADRIDQDIREAMAAATEAGLVVNHRDRQLLNPNRSATRAEAAAFVYQALVHTNRAEKIPSQYLVE